MFHPTTSQICTLLSIPNKILSYIDDFNYTARETDRKRSRGRIPLAITASQKARSIVSDELEALGWSRDTDKDEKVNFGVGGEAKWVGITFTHDLSLKIHMDLYRKAGNVMRWTEPNGLETILYCQH